jgi:hypothetical protein
MQDMKNIDIKEEKKYIAWAILPYPTTPVHTHTPMHAHTLTDSLTNW